MSNTSEPEDKVLFAPRLKSLVLHLWSGSMAPSIDRLSRVQLYDEHRDRLLELPVDVISVFQGNHELVLWRNGVTTFGRDFNYTESLRAENVVKLNLPNYMPVAMCLYSRKEAGDQPDTWRKLRDNLFSLTEWSASGYSVHGIRLSVLLVANALNNGWMSDRQLVELCFMLKPAAQSHALISALRSAGLDERYLVYGRNVMDAAHLVMERGEEFTTTLIKNLR